MLSFPTQLATGMEVEGVCMMERLTGLGIGRRVKDILPENRGPLQKSRVQGRKVNARRRHLNYASYKLRWIIALEAFKILLQWRVSTEDPSEIQRTVS